jgi:hypothetical protein
MTRGTGGGIHIIDSHYPGFPFHVQPILESPIENPMFRLLVNLDLRVIRTEMALAAVFGFSGLSFGKTMTGMARAAGSWNPIGVDPTDPRIRPGCGIKFSILENFNLGTMTLPATDRDGCGSSYDLSEIVVQGVEDLPSLGMMTPCHLLDLLCMAASTVLGSDEKGNCIALMIHGIHIPFVGLMAVIAIDARLPHGPETPLRNQSRRKVLMAFDALLSLGSSPLGGRQGDGRAFTSRQSSESQQCNDHNTQGSRSHGKPPCFHNSYYKITGEFIPTSTGPRRG